LTSPIITKLVIHHLKALEEEIPNHKKINGFFDNCYYRLTNIFF